METSNLQLLPCPFCGEPADEGARWPGHYGCSDEGCGAYQANLTREQWNSRASSLPLDVTVDFLRKLYMELVNHAESGAAASRILYGPEFTVLRAIMSELAAPESRDG